MCDKGMELDRSLLRDNIPCVHKCIYDSRETDTKLLDEVEQILKEQIDSGERHALFLLGQFYFEQESYDLAMHYFESAANDEDWQAIFQLGVMFYDGLNCTPDPKKGFDYMLRVANSTSQQAAHLVRSAQYNIGRAYYQGAGVKANDDEAEKYWLLAADDGNPQASVKAQSTLGLFYCCTDHLDLRKSFFWHSEACGNGSLESQGALAVMYLNGLGTKRNEKSAFICLQEASARGNIYAMGQLVSYYYQKKFYTKAVELAIKVSHCQEVEQISKETGCLAKYIRRGVSLASFYYARCLTRGRAVKQDEAEAKKFYSRSFVFDADMCAKLQLLTQHGII